MYQTLATLHLTHFFQEAKQEIRTQVTLYKISSFIKQHYLTLHAFFYQSQCKIHMFISISGKKNFFPKEAENGLHSLK